MVVIRALPMSLLVLPLPTAALSVFCISLCFILVRLIYRLLWHPLASFPGPRRAAITTWYRAYYDIILDGEWVYHLESLHEKYGQDNHFIIPLSSSNPIRLQAPSFEWALTRYLSSQHWNSNGLMYPIILSFISAIRRRTLIFIVMPHSSRMVCSTNVLVPVSLYSVWWTFTWRKGDVWLLDPFFPVALFSN